MFGEGLREGRQLLLQVLITKFYALKTRPTALFGMKLVASILTFTQAVCEAHVLDLCTRAETGMMALS